MLGFNTTTTDQFVSVSLIALASIDVCVACNWQTAVYQVSPLKLYSFNRCNQSQVNKFACDLNELLSLTANSG